MGLPTFPACQRRKMKIRPDECPFLHYLSIHLPTGHRKQPDAIEIDHAASIILQSNGLLLSVLATIIGPDALHARMSDLAVNNSVNSGSIPVFYNHVRDEQPHNILLGIPYTGNFLANVFQIETVAPHELTHTILGKFNDGLAEPIANLFIPQVTYNPGRPRRRDQFVARATLELVDASKTVCTLGSLEDLFSHRPYFRNVACRYYSQQLQSETNDADVEPNQATHDFIRLLVRQRTQRLLAPFGDAKPDPLSKDETVNVEDWIDQNDQLKQLRRNNPNENSGIARGFNLRLGRALMLFLLEHAFGKDLEKVEPIEAREKIHHLLTFYFAPLDDSSLQAFGFSDYGELTAKFYDVLESQTESIVSENSDEWEKVQMQPVIDGLLST